MTTKIPYWIKFAIIFTIIMAILVFLDKLIFPEMGTFGPSLILIPLGIFIEFIGVEIVGQTEEILTILTYAFILGSILGLIVQKIKTKPGG